jgi:hypothetical protein
MKKIFVILGAVFLTSIVAGAQTLPAVVENYLRKNYPTWEIGESWVADSAPRRAIEKGDFDGDGKTDYALLITKDDRIYALALLAAKNGFKAYNLIAQNTENRWIAGIDITPKGSKVYFNNEEISAKSFLLKNDGIEIYDGERHGVTYYWQNGKFLSTSGL